MEQLGHQTKPKTLHLIYSKHSLPLRVEHAVFENSVVPDMLLSNNPISTDSGSRTISVLAPDHALS